MKKIARILLLVVSAVVVSYVTFAQANTKLSNLVAPTAVNVNLLPKTASSFNLGNAALPWNQLFSTTLNNSGNVTIGGSMTMSSFTTGILHSNASGVISSGPLTAAQIPSLSSLYLPISGGTLTGSLMGTNATFSGNATAASFMKTGGTANQILAANGSVITAGTGITISGGIISSSGSGSSSGGITSLNGLTAASQSFVVATSGTDFSIQSTGTAHIFLMPSASSASRGLLTSADWITFNSKQTAMVLTTTGTSGPATFNGNTLNIPVYTAAGGQAITLSGDVTGSGTTAIATTLKTVTQGAGSNFVKITLDGNGRVTGNTVVGNADVVSALGYTPYNSTNPSGYITSSALSAYLPLTGGTLTGSLNGPNAVFTSIKAGGTLFPASAGSANQVLTADGSGNASWATPANSGSGWGLAGNSGTVDGTNFIGTTDYVPFNIRVNNLSSGRIDPVSGNAFYGYQAALSTTSGSGNTVIGSMALFSSTNSVQNTAIGFQALYSSTSSSSNTAVGYKALYSNTTGYSNTANGDAALSNNTTGTYNTANGIDALGLNTVGFDNTAFGDGALYYNSSGYYNAASGSGALSSNTTGYNNTADGYSALSQNTTGYDLTAIGTYAGANQDGLYNSTALGFNTYIYSSNQVVLGNDNVQSLVCAVNLTVTSDGRYKSNIKQNVPGLSFINQLKPITYTLNTAELDAKLHSNQKEFKMANGRTISHPAVDKASFEESSKIIHTGFVAQDVETAAKKLGYDFSGVDKPKDASKSVYGLRYAEFVVPLVKAVQELSAANDNMKAQNDSLQSQLTGLQDQLNEIKAQLASIGKEGMSSSQAALSNARLEQNIPNPFRQTTEINYFVPQNAGSAFIRVTDMNGISIKNVAINSKGSGQLTVSTAQLASGTYTYTLVVDGSIIDTKKMVLIH